MKPSTYRRVVTMNENGRSVVQSDERLQAYALREGWFGYDRKKYAAMLRGAFRPFEFVHCTTHFPK